MSGSTGPTLLALVCSGSLIGGRGLVGGAIPRGGCSGGRRVRERERVLSAIAYGGKELQCLRRWAFAGLSLDGTCGIRSIHGEKIIFYDSGI